MITERGACDTARISVRVTEFLEIGRGFIRADIELTDTGHGKVSQGRINDPIVVSGEAYLEFSVSAREGNHYTYSPVGISFREIRGDAPVKIDEHHDRYRDLLGHAAFPTRTFASRGNTMQLSLFDANPEPAEFKFDLLIQRSDGMLGIIDPAIRNDAIMK